MSEELGRLIRDARRTYKERLCAYLILSGYPLVAHEPVATALYT